MGRWWPILHCILWISQCVFKRIKLVLAQKSVSASCRGSDSDLVAIHVCGGLSLQTFLLSRGPATQQEQIRHWGWFPLLLGHENLFQRLWCLSLETMSLCRAKWARIPSLDTADPAYGAAWSSERWSDAVPPVFGGRRRCRFSNLQTKNKTGTRFIDDQGVVGPSLHCCSNQKLTADGLSEQKQAIALALLHTGLSIKAACIRLEWWGDEGGSFGRNCSPNGRSAQCHCLWRVQYVKKRSN